MPPQRVVPDRAQRASVRDDEYPLARMGPCDSLDRREHPPAVLFTGFAARPVAVGKPGGDLGARQAGPATDVDLAQPRIEPHRQAVGRGDGSAVSCARRRSLE